MPAKKKSIVKKTTPTLAAFSPALVADVRQLIAQARQQVARAVDSGVVLLYWSIGNRIRRDILQDQRAEYGKQIVAALSRQLTAEFGNGFNRFSLSRMISPSQTRCQTLKLCRHRRHNSRLQPFLSAAQPFGILGLHPF